MRREEPLSLMISTALLLIFFTVIFEPAVGGDNVSRQVSYSFDRNGNRIDDCLEDVSEFPQWALVHSDTFEHAKALRPLLERAGCDIGSSLSSIPVIIVSIPDRTSLEDASKLPFLEVIERDSEVRFAINNSVKAMKVEQSSIYPGETARDLGYDGEGMTIAVLDLGIDNDHEVLQGSFVAGVDFTLPDTPVTPRDGSFDPDDKGGHGTGVACVLASRGDANGNFRGIAPAAGIIDLKMSDYNPAYVRAMAEAIDWCLQNKDTDWGNGHVGIDVISMSALTSVDPDGSIARLLQLIAENGIPFIQAAGNDGVQQGEDPATYFWSDYVITAGGLDDRRTIERSDDIYWSGATYGPRVTDGDEDPYDELRPDVVATAVNLTVAAHSTTTDPASGWRIVEGTSYATPHVSGVVALMLQANPRIAELGDLRVLESIRSILHESAEARGEPYDPALSEKYSVRYGFGILDGYEAVKTALDFNEWNRPPSIIEFTATPNTVAPEDTSTIRIDADDPDGDLLEFLIEASGGDITGNGPIWTWTAPEDEGEYLIEVTVLDPSGSSDSASITLTVRDAVISNSPPVIQSFTSSDGSVETGEIVYLYVEASDPDGDPLQYGYSASSGRVIGSGDEVQFRSPDSAADVSIIVTVSDGRGASDDAQLLIQVVSPPPPEPPIVASVLLTPSYIEEGDASSNVKISAFIRETTSDVDTVQADLAGIGQRTRKFLSYVGSVEIEGQVLLEYSLGLGGLGSLGPGNYSILVTAHDERNYVSEPFEVILSVTPSQNKGAEVPDTESSSVFPFWVLIPIVLIGAAILVGLFFVIRMAGTRKVRTTGSSSPVYVAIEAG
ncbi:MAG: S8 family serine peptidase [Thermoplasmatota archaeon]